MKSKWHISILIIALTFLGVVNQQQQTSVPNQEIVLQFTNVEISAEKTQNTIAIVKKQLQNIGVSKIQVVEKEKGKLKITYYSDANVAIVKESLLKERELKLNYTVSNESEKHQKLPLDNDAISYNLDVYEIQNANDLHLGFDGFVIEQKTESDRLLIPNVYVPFIGIDERKINNSVKVASKSWRTIEIAIDNHSYKIPEVRAGPLV